MNQVDAFIFAQYLNHPNVTRAEKAPVMDEVWKMAANSVTAVSNRHVRI